MAESSKLTSKKTDKKSKGKAVEGDSNVSVDVSMEPSVSKGLKRKKSAADVAAAGKDDGDKLLKRKKVKKDVEEVVPVEGKKKKTKATEALDAAPESLAEPMLVDEDAAPKPKSKKFKAKAPEAIPDIPSAEAESSTTPAKKSKKSKAPPSAEPEPLPIEDAPKPTKKGRKSKADAVAEPAPESSSVGDAPTSKKSKKSKAETTAAPEPVPLDDVVKPSKKSKKTRAEAGSESALLPPQSAVVEDVPEPSKKAKRAKADAAPDAPTSTSSPVEDAPKPSKKVKKSKAEAAPEAVAEPPTTAEEPKPSKKSKKAKVDIVSEPVPAVLESTPVEEPKSSKKSKKSKLPAPSPPPEPTPAPAAINDAEEDEASLHGLSTDDDDSSDDDDGYMEVEVSAFDVSKLPTIAKDDATVKRKLENAKRQPTGDRGVLFLGRIPHGFYEDQLKAYFSQFGNVTRLRVSRNKKTGRSKHYGFLEFDSSSVAQIVAETMDNYLLMGHIMRCKVIPKAEVHPELWVGANRKWREVPTVRVAQAEYNKLRTPDEQLRAAHRLLKRQQQRQRNLEKAGIVYDFGTAGYQAPKVQELAA
ncbi:hypothetical protein B0H15DRAFT_873884 [Mycena belliarum]|uniref:RRM domain-containing protein n=1 Tax=Mycena belliarum TaxID=1033014 RepID=A0AAD6UKP2_9AGAR|nr:hypothetical protein B0H15DRAFT_873884 [Mycena belliae]